MLIFQHNYAVLLRLGQNWLLAKVEFGRVLRSSEPKFCLFVFKYYEMKVKIGNEPNVKKTGG